MSASIDIAWAHCNTIDHPEYRPNELIDIETFAGCDIGFLHELSAIAYADLAPIFDKQELATHFTPYGPIETGNVGMMLAWRKTGGVGPISLENVLVGRPTTSRNLLQTATLHVPSLSATLTVTGFRIPARLEALSTATAVTSLMMHTDVYVVSGVAKEDQSVVQDVMYRVNTTNVDAYTSRIADADAQVLMTTSPKVVPTNIQSFKGGLTVTAIVTPDAPPSALANLDADMQMSVLENHFDDQAGGEGQPSENVGEGEDSSSSGGK